VYSSTKLAKIPGSSIFKKVMMEYMMSKPSVTGVCTVALRNTEQGLGKADSHSAGQETTRRLWNAEVLYVIFPHYCTQPF
jgi:hypothetical protein